MTSWPTRSRADYLKHRYGGAQGIVNALEMRRVAALLAKAPFAPRSVLDAPCGHGRFTPLLRRLAQDRLVCADHHEGHLDSLAKSEPSAGTPFACVRLDLLRPLPFSDHSFDLVFCFRFFHHVFNEADLRFALTELVRVSRGALLFSYYDARSLHTIQKRIQYTFSRRRRLKVLFYGRRVIDRVLADLGCRVVSDRAILPGLHAQRVVLTAPR